ncbi:MAG: alpha/beta hydrolase [Flavobacteriales bacterium]|jgi:pimeloyl-ACP methyl ester carboxylesterase|nr:alpha/beta hydrolase [Flavobacteriales bacterium]
MNKKQLIIPTKRERDILADISYKDNDKDKPLVIFCHGYKGYKDWGAWNLVAEAFVQAGFVFLKFNFSHNGGTLAQPIDFPDLQAFGENTYTKEVEDLHTVINWAQANNGLPILKDSITLIGHSRGGGIVSIVAKEHKAVRKLVTWAGVSDYKKRFPKKEKFEAWKDQGVFYVKNGRTKQDMPHFFSFYTDFVENEQRLTIKGAIKQLNKPQLIIHGDQDEAVSIKEAEALKLWNPKAVLKLVKGGNHTFGSKHPWKEIALPNHLQTIVNETIDFI